MASTTVWIGVALFLAFLALAYPSAWLYGPRWFLLTIGTLAGSFAALGVDALGAQAGPSGWFAVAILGWVFAFFFYLIGARYLTQTKLLDLTYQSHPALLQYISERKITSTLAPALRALGPALAIAMLVIVVLGLWAKSKGVLA